MRVTFGFAEVLGACPGDDAMSHSFSVKAVIWFCIL
jgi:hypothetical protein